MYLQLFPHLSHLKGGGFLVWPACVSSIGWKRFFTKWTLIHCLSPTIFAWVLMSAAIWRIISNVTNWLSSEYMTRARMADSSLFIPIVGFCAILSLPFRIGKVSCREALIRVWYCPCQNSSAPRPIHSTQTSVTAAKNINYFLPDKLIFINFADRRKS